MEKYREEVTADASATILTAMSAARLDGVPPDFALIGGTFGLACLDVMRRASGIVLDGEEGVDAGDEQHPPHKWRANFIADVFGQHISVQSSEEGPSDVDVSVVVDARDSSVDPEVLAQRRRRVFQFAVALFSAWDIVRPRLLQDHENNRELHTRWERRKRP